MEDLVDVIGYEELYRINRNGDVWNCKRNRLMKQTVNSIGYLVVGFNKNNKSKQYLIHRLIGIHFIPNPDNLPEIDHIDRNRSNNNLENLRWVSKSTNQHNKLKCKRNKSGFKNILTSIIINKYKKYEYWQINIKTENMLLIKNYNKSKYTLEEVVAFRNAKYIEYGLEKCD